MGIDGGGRLHRVAEVSSPGADALTLFYGAYTGVQIIEPELIERIPDGPCDILRTAYADVMTERGPVYGHFVPAASLWLDVGNIERYLHAHWAIIDGDITGGSSPVLIFVSVGYRNGQRSVKRPQLSVRPSLCPGQS